MDCSDRCPVTVACRSPAAPDRPSPPYARRMRRISHFLWIGGRERGSEGSPRRARMPRPPHIRTTMPIAGGGRVPTSDPIHGRRSTAHARAAPVPRDQGAVPPDTILLYRLGDFYETFDDDAHRVAEALHITLTSREFGRGVRVPLAGIPHHALNGYLARLLASGLQGRRLRADERARPRAGRARRRARGHARHDRRAGAAARPREQLPRRRLPPRRRARRWPTSTSPPASSPPRSSPATDAEAALEAELARLAPAEMPAARRAPALPLAGTADRASKRALFEPERAAETAAARRFASPRWRRSAAPRLPARDRRGGRDRRATCERTNPDLLGLLAASAPTPPARYLVARPADAAQPGPDAQRPQRRGRAAACSACSTARAPPMGGRLLRRLLGQPLLDLDAIEAAARRGRPRSSATAPRRRRLGAAARPLGDLERLTGRVCQGTGRRRASCAAAGRGAAPGAGAARTSWSRSPRWRRAARGARSLCRRPPS